MDLYDFPNTHLSDLIEVPEWVTACQVAYTYDVAAVCKGGCSSGVCMKATSYSSALNIMQEHGDEVLDYVLEYEGSSKMPDCSWSELAAYFLSIAIDYWAMNVEEELALNLSDMHRG